MELGNLNACFHNNFYGLLLESDNSCLENGAKTPRQLHSEEDDEERLQADFKRAVRHSCGKSFFTFCSSTVHLSYMYF